MISTSTIIADVKVIFPQGNYPCFNHEDDALAILLVKNKKLYL
jgi:hypothetical protein